MHESLYRAHDALEDAHWWFLGRRAIVRAFLQAHLPAAERRRVLDVGCGTGGMLPLLAEFGQVTALDESAEALAFAQKRAGGARLLHGAVPDGLPAGETFDLVTAFDVLEHIPRVEAAAGRLRAALAPGGCLVVTVPAYAFLWSEHDVTNHHQRRYTEALLRQHLAAGGLAVQRASYFNTWLFPAVVAARLLAPAKAGTSDLTLPTTLVNRALRALFSSERHLVPRVRLPFGVSLVALARAA